MILEKIKWLSGVLALAGLLVVSTVAQADEIGFNFQGNNASALGGDATTGAAGTATDDWEELTGVSGGPGTFNGVTVEWASNGTWSSGSTDNNNLTNGYLDTGDTAAALVTVSGLNTVLNTAGMSRDIYVYFGSDNAGRTGHVYLNPTFGADQTGASVTASDDAFEFSSLVGGALTQTTDATLDGTTAGANYAVFSIAELVDEFSFAVARPAAGSTSTGLHGFEVVEVNAIPEPGSLAALVGLSGLVLARRRRR